MQKTADNTNGNSWPVKAYVAFDYIKLNNTSHILYYAKITTKISSDISSKWKREDLGYIKNDSYPSVAMLLHPSPSLVDNV